MARDRIRQLRRVPEGWDRFAKLRLDKQMRRHCSSLAGIEYPQFVRALDLDRPVTMKGALVLIIATPLILGLIVAMMFLQDRFEWIGALVMGAALLGMALVVWLGIKHDLRLNAVLRSARLGPVRAAARGSESSMDRLLDSRRAYWRSESARKRACVVWTAVPVGYRTGLVVPLALCLLTLSAPFIAPPGFTMPLSFVALGVMLGVPWVWGRRMRVLARDAIERERCPHCGYGLEGLPVGLDDLPAAGPALCPECATEWPLVPSATPEEVWRRLAARQVAGGGTVSAVDGVAAPTAAALEAP